MTHLQGHLGISRCLTAIKADFVFRNMHKRVKTLVRSCPQCQIGKVGRGINPIYGKYKEVSYKFQALNADILKLPVCRGYKYLLTLIDRYSHYCLLYTHLTL